MSAYFDKEEAGPIEMIAQRVSQNGVGEWEDWTPSQIRDPASRRIEFNLDALIGFGQTHPGRSAYNRLNEFERYRAFRDFLYEYPSFVKVAEFNGELPIDIRNTDWLFDMVKNAPRHGLKPILGYGFHNALYGGKRLAKHIGLIKLVDPATGIYVEMSDTAQLMPDLEHKIIKLLFLHNPNKPNPYGMRRFVKTLRRVLIDDLQYDWAFGHCATIDQPDHPHNAEIDKRFLRHDTWHIELEDGTVQKYKESNLCWYWQRMGMLAAPSPETDNELTVGLMSVSYRQELLQINQKVWRQIFQREI